MKENNIHITNHAEVCHIEIEGTIGVPEEWQFEEPARLVATYEKFRSVLERITAIAEPEIVVDIRSTGGDVNDALLIHDALRATGAHITTRCYGYTASAATIIAQAASEGCRQISANALYLIHTATCSMEGNAADFESRAEMLRQTDKRIAAVYAARSGCPAEEYIGLMEECSGQGRWLSPEETVEAGLADTVLAPESLSATPSVSNLARGWERLLAKIGLAERSDEPQPTAANCNVLHCDHSASLRPAREMAQRQAAVQATVTSAREDPATDEHTPTANERAYAEDARRLCA